MSLGDLEPIRAVFALFGIATCDECGDPFCRECGAHTRWYCDMGPRFGCEPGWRCECGWATSLPEWSGPPPVHRAEWN